MLGLHDIFMSLFLQPPLQFCRLVRSSTPGHVRAVSLVPTPISALARLTTVARHTAPAADQIPRLGQGDLRGTVVADAAPEARPIRLQAWPAFQGPYRTVQTLGFYARVRDRKCIFIQPVVSKIRSIPRPRVSRVHGRPHLKEKCGQLFFFSLAQFASILVAHY